MKTLFIFFAFLIGKSTSKMALNELIPICDAKDPNLNSCVLKSANLIVPYLSKGIKSYGFPPLDPLKVSRMDIGQNNGPITLKLELINTTHLGLSTLNFRSASANEIKVHSKERLGFQDGVPIPSIINSFEIDTKRNQWIINGTIPYYSLAGKYMGNGRILLVPLVGNGKANFTFNDVGIDFVINGAPKKEKSNIYFDLASLRVYFKFNKSYVYLTNLFGGNKVLGERTSRFLNENSDEVVSGLKNTLEDVYSALYLNLLKRITSNVPYNQIFNNV